MNRIILIALFSLVLFKVSNSQPLNSQPKPFNYERDYKTILVNTLDENSVLFYQKLLKRFQDNDSTMTPYETLALMIGYTVNPNYQPMEDMKHELEIFELNKKAQFRDVITASQDYLKDHPLSLLILREISFAYNRLKIKDSAQYYMDLNDKIMAAMIYSGKGKTISNPIFSLGFADGEYFIPNVGMGIEAKTTSWTKKDEFIEIIRAVDDYAVTGNFYFMIDHAKQKTDNDKAAKLAALKALKEKQEKEKKALKRKKITINFFSKKNSERSSKDSSLTPQIPAAIKTSKSKQRMAVVDSFVTPQVPTAVEISQPRQTPAVIDSFVSPQIPIAIDSFMTPQIPAAVETSPSIQTPVIVDTPPSLQTPPAVDSTMKPNTLPAVNSSSSPQVPAAVDSSITPQAPTAVDTTSSPQTPPAVDSTMAPNTLPAVDSSSSPQVPAAVDSSVTPQVPAAVDTSSSPQAPPAEDSSSRPQNL